MRPGRRPVTGFRILLQPGPRLADSPRAGPFGLVGHPPDARYSSSRRSLLLCDGVAECDLGGLADRLEAHGAEALEGLSGGFALVLIDLATGRSCLARDRLGIRPLYKAATGSGGWAIATSIRGLIDTGLPVRIDPCGLDSYLRMGTIYEPRTLVANATAVLPGTWEQLEPGGTARARAWWTPEDAAPPPAPTDRDLLEALHAAVREQARTSAALGVLASGGSDSTGLLLALEDLDLLPVHTVSLGFAGAEADLSEHPYQRAAAARFGSRHHEWLATPEEVEQLLPAFFDAMDQPTIDGLNSFLSAKLAADAGVEVLLTGFGGDELFAGYDAFRSLAAAAAVSAALRHLPERMRRSLSSLLDSRAGYARPTWSKLAVMIAEAPHLDAYYCVRRSLFLPDQVARLTGRRAELDDEVLTRRSNPDHSLLARWSALELGNYVANTLVRAGDRFTRAHGIELRFPYLDPRLIELVLRIPDGRKRSRRHRKPLLRDVFAGRLPDFVFAKRKGHFQVPLQRWLTRPAFEFTGVPELDPLEVGRVVEAYRSAPSLRTSSRVWGLYVLGQTLPRLLGNARRPSGGPQVAPVLAY